MWIKNLIQGTKVSCWAVLLIISQSLWAVPPPSFSADFPIFSKDNSQLTFISRDYAKTDIVKISTANGKVLKRVPFALSSDSLVLAPTPDGFKLLAVNPRGIDVIHNGTGKVLRTLPNPAAVNDSHHLQQSPDGVWLAVPSIERRKIFIVHTGTKKIVHTIDLPQGRDINHIAAIGFSLNRRMIAYEIKTRNNTSLHVFDIYKKVEILAIDLPDTNLANSMDSNGKISFSKDGTLLLLADSLGKQTKLIDINKHAIKNLPPYDYPNFVGFTPDDNVIIIQTRSNRITLYNTKTGQSKNIPFNTQTEREYYGDSIVQSADRSMLALPLTSMQPNTINQIALINARTGQLIRILNQ